MAIADLPNIDSLTGVSRQNLEGAYEHPGEQSCSIRAVSLERTYQSRISMPHFPSYGQRSDC